MKARIQIIFFVMILGANLTTALVVINDYTAPLIEKNRVVKEESGVLRALQIDFSKENLKEIFAREVTIQHKAGETYYVTPNGEIAFAFKGPGLWGEIKGVLSLNADLTTIHGISITSQEETPGLGSQITEDFYLNDFKGKVFQPALKLIPAGKESTPNGIDVITGATISSEKFLAILNERHEKIRTLIKGGEK